MVSIPKNRLRKLISVLLVCAAVGFAEGASSESAAAEQELFRMINHERAQAGVVELQWNEWLAQAARKHAEEMARRGQLSHQFPGEPGLRDRLAATSLRFNASAENVAFGPTPAGINDDWMHSPGHRANILDPAYNAIGVAVARHGDEFYAVTDFAHSVPSLSASELEDAVASAINQARKAHSLPALPRRLDPTLRQFACEMAKNDRLNTSALLGRANVSASLAFTDPDPANIGSRFRNVANVTTSKAFAVGACFARSNTYVEGTNWIVVAFY
jgi:uncharacterized protein YkwD